MYGRDCGSNPSNLKQLSQKMGKSVNEILFSAFLLKSRPIADSIRMLFFHHLGLPTKAAPDIGGTQARTLGTWKHFSKMNRIFGHLDPSRSQRGNNGWTLDCTRIWKVVHCKGCALGSSVPFLFTKLFEFFGEKKMNEKTGNFLNAIFGAKNFKKIVKLVLGIDWGLRHRKVT